MSTTLNRKQAEKFAALVDNFKDVKWFAIEEDNSSSIGPVVRVKFSMFGNDSEPETTVDITDLSTW